MAVPLESFMEMVVHERKYGNNLVHCSLVVSHIKLIRLVGAV